MARVFVSSVIEGFKEFRNTAAAAAKAVDHEITRSEDFGALTITPQQACLAGVRESDIVVLLLGARYGGRQNSGISATHEEYREARGTKDLLVFVQDGVDRDPEQEEFIREVRSWAGGSLTESFRDVEDLRSIVTRSLYRLAMSRAVGPVDAEEMRGRALALLAHGRNARMVQLGLAVSGGPRQSIIRPSEIEAIGLYETLVQEATFGASRVFEMRHGTERRFEGEGLHIEQRDASIYVNEEGSVRVLMPASDPDSDELARLPVIIQEDVHDRLVRALRYVDWVLSRIDGTHKLTRVAPAALLLGGDHFGWKTREEHRRDHSHVTMRMGNLPGPVTLSPPDRARGALSIQAQQLAEDLGLLLRRGR